MYLPVWDEYSLGVPALPVKEFALEWYREDGSEVNLDKCIMYVQFGQNDIFLLIGYLRLIEQE